MQLVTQYDVKKGKEKIAKDIFNPLNVTIAEEFDEVSNFGDIPEPEDSIDFLTIEIDNSVTDQPKIKHSFTKSLNDNESTDELIRQFHEF